MGLRASLLKGGFSPYLALLLIVCLAASRVSSQESATETNDSNGLIKDLGRRSKAVANLCWQRSKPVIVNESNCTADTALLGGAAEDSILMPDPLPSVPSSSLSTSTTGSGSLNPGRSSPYAESFSFASGSTGSLSSSLSLPTGEETPIRSSLISQISTIP